MHPTYWITLKTEKGKKIMKRMVKKIVESKKFNHYCVNVLKMYNIGRVSLPA